MNKQKKNSDPIFPHATNIQRVIFVQPLKRSTELFVLYGAEISAAYGAEISAGWQHRTCGILSGWMAERTKMRVTMSREEGGKGATPAQGPVTSHT